MLYLLAFLVCFTLAACVALSFRVHRLEWEVDQLHQKLGKCVSPFPIPFEPEADPEQALQEYADRPAFLKRQAE